MHNIKLERCWADPVVDLYELCITCSNDQITACAMECWGSNEILDDFANKIKQLLSPRNSSAVQIIRRKLKLYLISGKNSDIICSQFA